MLNVESAAVALGSVGGTLVAPWVWFALASAVVMALVSLIEKKILQHEHSLSFSVGHALLALLLALPLAFFVDFSKLTPFLVVIIYVATFVASVAFWLGAKATKHLEISVSSPLTVVTIAFVPFFAFFILGERLLLQHVVGILMIFAGVFALELIVHKGKLLDLLSVKGNEHYFALVVLSSILYAGTSIVDKIALSSISVFTYILIAHIFIAINSLLLMVVLDHEFKRDLRQLFSQDFKIVFLVSFLSVVQRLLMAFAISGAFVSLAIAVKRLSTLFTTIIGGKLFHEENLAQKAVVSLIMIAGAVLLVLQ